jgi:catechol 2,3-dioxygenase-like lactoylglutathione lyase family enzyme
MRLQHIDHVAITVKDLEPSRAWYRDVLGLERRFEDEWGDVPTVMCAGDTCVAMFPAATRDPKRTPGTDTIAMRHVAFRVDAANFTAAQAEFRERGIPFEFSDHGIAHSVYISDPDGHRIEITTYEV